MTISANFWKTLREARINQLVHCGTERELAEFTANAEIKHRKRVSDIHGPWVGILATMEVEEDDEGLSRWFLCSHKFRIIE